MQYYNFYIVTQTDLNKRYTHLFILMHGAR